MTIRADILASQKPIDEKKMGFLLSEEIQKSRWKLVVLDDDPTGVQTVHDIFVYTDWSLESMKDAFQEEKNLFYILTNSRGLTEEETAKVHHEIAAAVIQAAQEAGRDYLFISRSDSTLRGHYPLETDILRADYEKSTGRRIDGEILCFVFFEGGRYTIGNIHYVRYGDQLVPACETEFAQDKTFGYVSLTMPEYVEEKTGGAFRASDVVCISDEDIRSMNLDGIERQLEAVSGGEKIIVNASDYAALKVFCIALYRAMAHGKLFMMRTAASFVKVMGGVTDQPLLTHEQLVRDRTGRGGVIVIGSHTDKTTRQLDALRKLDGLVFTELNASLVQDEDAFEADVERCLSEEEAAILSGKTACCYTTRALITADTGNPEDELRLSVRISDAVQSLVGRLKIRPSFVVAKGGITSSDVGIKALRVKKALVLGQVAPGIPVWQTGSESKWPGTPYVIFPGNVGEDGTLAEVVRKLMYPEI